MVVAPGRSGSGSNPASPTCRRAKDRTLREWLRHKDGSYRWLAWEAATDRNRIYAMGRDITDLKRAEQERKRLDEIEDMLQRRQNVEIAGADGQLDRA